MVKIWDDRLKRLAGTLPGDFVDWLMPGAELVNIVSLELKTLARTVSADTLFEVRLHGKKALLHIEFQRRPNAQMAQRVWEYNVLATITHKCPVYSFIIYLTPGGTIPETPLQWGLPEYELVHIFRFTNIMLWELPVEDLKKTGLKGLLPLCLLTKGGAQRDVAQEVFQEVGDNRELLTLALTLASMVFTDEADQLWLEGEVAMLEDIVRDTWFYQKILKEGREKATIETLRMIILDTVGERFPSLLELAKTRVEAMRDPILLRKLNTRIVIAQTSDEAEKALQES